MPKVNRISWAPTLNDMCASDSLVDTNAARLVKSSKIVLGKYQLDTAKLLGTGAWYDVYSAEHVTTGQSVAVKTFNVQALRTLPDKDLAARFTKEIEAFQTLSLANEGTEPASSSSKRPLLDSSKLFVSLIDFSKDATGKPSKDADDGYYTVLEHGEQSLGEWLKERSDRFEFLDVEEVREIAVFLVHCLQALQVLGLCHLDIKIDNILRFGGRWKLIDMASMESQRQGASIPCDCFTPLYASPELASAALTNTGSMLHGVDVLPALDAWSAGIVLLDVLAHRPALEETKTSLQQAMLFDEGNSLDEWYRWISYPTELNIGEILSVAPAASAALLHSAPGLQELIKGLLAKDPSERLSPVVLRTQSFVRGAPHLEEAQLANCSQHVIDEGPQMSPGALMRSLYDKDDLDSCDDFLCKSVDGTLDGSMDPEIQQEIQRWFEQTSPASARPRNADQKSVSTLPSFGAAKDSKGELQKNDPSPLDTCRTIASCQSETLVDMLQVSFTNSEVHVEFRDGLIQGNEVKQSQQTVEACHEAPADAVTITEASRNAAATCLQSAERGRKARQEVKIKRMVSEDVEKKKRSDERKKQLRAEMEAAAATKVRAEMEASAATKVQSVHRGCMARQEVQKKRDEKRKGENSDQNTYLQNAQAHDLVPAEFQDFQQFFQLTAEWDTHIGKLLAQIQEAEEMMTWKGQLEADMQARLDLVQVETGHVESAIEVTSNRLQEERKRGEELRSTVSRVSAEVEAKTMELRHIQLEKDSMLLNGMPFNSPSSPLSRGPAARLPFLQHSQISPKQRRQLPPLPLGPARVRPKTFSVDPTLERGQSPAIEGIWTEVGKLGSAERAEIVRRLQAELSDQDSGLKSLADISAGSQDSTPLCGSAARALRSARGTNQE